MPFDASFIDHQYTNNVVYLNARHLSPSLGRFLSQDAHKQFSSEYVYGNGSVILHSDPTGNMIPLGGEAEVAEVEASALSTEKPNQETLVKVKGGLHPKEVGASHSVILSGDVRVEGAMSRDIDNYVSTINVTDETREKIKKDMLQRAVSRFHELSEKEARGTLRHSVSREGNAHNVTERQELSMFRDILNRNNKEMESLGLTDEMARQVWSKGAEQFDIDEMPDFHDEIDDRRDLRRVLYVMTVALSVGLVIIGLASFGVI